MFTSFALFIDITILKESCFDIIVMNPPYVRREDSMTVEESALRWESRDSIILPPAVHETAFVDAVLKSIENGAIRLSALYSDCNVPRIVVETDGSRRQATKISLLAELFGALNLTACVRKDYRNRARLVLFKPKNKP